MASSDKSRKMKVDKKKESGKKFNKTKKEDSDSDNDDDFSPSSDEEMDEQEYRKFLKKMFPSNHINKKVESGEKLKKALKEEEKSRKNTKKSKKIIEEDEEEEEEDDEEEEEEEEEVKKTNSKSKKSSKKGKKISAKKNKIIKKSKSNEEDHEDEDDDEDNDADDEDEYDDVIELKNKTNKSNKFNIIFTVGNSEDDDEDIWEDIDEDDSDYDDDDVLTENEDDSVSDSEEELDEDEEDDEDESEDSDNAAKQPTTKKNKKVSEKDSSETSEVKKNSKKEKISLKDEDEFLSQLKEICEKNSNSAFAKQLISDAEEKMKETKKKCARKIEKTQERNGRIFKKIIRDKNTMNDFEFFEKLEIEQQKKIIKELREINAITRIEKPYRLSILDADMPVLFKGAAMKKVNSLRYMDPGSGEYYKMKNWVDTFMRIPFAKQQTLPISMSDGQEACHSFMENAKTILDSAVYGMNDAKMQIMQMLGQLIINPDSIGTAIAIHGPMGTGKTSIVKEGISKILNRPFAFIALGGATDSSFLEGHSYTYEGSTWGKIVQILIDSKCMNPVIYFDELDKISDTPKGEEIAGILTHLTDTSQNSEFHDKYFTEVNFDLSKCLFIFSYNDESKVNPILRDRMYRIKTTGYDKKQKTAICNSYLLPKIREQVKFADSDIIIPDESLQYIMETHCNGEDGVRNMKRCLEIIHTKINLYRLMKPGSNLFEEQKSLVVEFPFTVTKDIVDKLIIKERNDNMALKGMYV